MNSITKVCSKCKSEKILEDFRKDKKRKDGRGSLCKTCSNAESVAWQKNNKDKVRKNFLKWYANNKETINKKEREWRKNNPEKSSERNKKHYYSNLEKSRERALDWRNRNIEKAREIARKWTRANPDKKRINANNYAARKIKNGGKITVSEWFALCEKYDNTCLCCGRKDVKLTLDHVMPLKVGGTNNIENAQPLCQACNSSKGIKSTDYR